MKPNTSSTHAPIESVGFIGYGPMGQLLSDLLPAHVEVRAFDPRYSCEDKPERACMVSGPVAAKSDVVIIATTADAISEVLDDMSTNFREDTLVAQIASVQVALHTIFQKKIPKADVLHMHPLFGPQSVAESGAAGKSVFVTSEVNSISPRGFELLEFFRDVRLSVRHIGPEFHDAQMARIQAEPFFWGRVLTHAGIDAQVHPKQLRRLLELDDMQSEQLFQTIQTYNPYARQVRHDSITNARYVQDRLKGREYPLPLFIGAVLLRSCSGPIKVHEQFTTPTMQGIEQLGVMHRNYNPELQWSSEGCTAQARKEIIEKAENIHGGLIVGS